MFRAPPVMSKVLEKKWNKKELEIHNRRVQAAQSTITHKAYSRARSFSHNRKKEAIMECKKVPPESTL